MIEGGGEGVGGRLAGTQSHVQLVALRKQLVNLHDDAHSYAKHM